MSKLSIYLFSDFSSVAHYFLEKIIKIFKTLHMVKKYLTNFCILLLVLVNSIVIRMKILLRATISL